MPALAVLGLAGLLVVGAAVLGVTTGRPRASAAAVHGTSLCESPGTITQLVVRRTDAFPEDHFVFSFGSTVVVHRAAGARAVARALCALPAMPGKAIICPADFGIVYHLSFADAREQFRAVRLEATGCQTVRGIDQRRWIARSPHFWHVLGTAMHLDDASLATFRGSGPGS